MAPFQTTVQSVMFIFLAMILSAVIGVFIGVFIGIGMRQEALKSEPDNTRYYFYLAQSYFDATEWNQCIRYYQHRLGMGKINPEESYTCRFKIAVAKYQIFIST